MEDVTYYFTQGDTRVAIPVNDQHWRVEVMYDCHLHPVIEYDGSDYNELTACLGGLCLSQTVEKIRIFRNNELHRYITVK